MVHLLLGEMSSSALPVGFTWATMVPELLVNDLNRSLHFWCDLCGFVVAYDRPEDRFAYLDRSGCQIMLGETMAPGRHWTTAPLEQPFGRGINFQITVNDVNRFWPLCSAHSGLFFLAWRRSGIERGRAM